MGYQYFDTPEGQDGFKKMWFLSKKAAAGGVLLATYDVVLISRPQGYAKTAARFAYIVGPIVGMAATWGGTVCIANSIRKKDDGLNYFIGGIGASTIFGAWRKSFGKGAAAAVILGSLGYLAHFSLEKKIPLLHSPANKVWGTLDHCSPSRDWTIRGYDRKT